MHLYKFVLDKNIPLIYIYIYGLDQLVKGEVQ